MKSNHFCDTYKRLKVIFDRRYRDNVVPNSDSIHPTIFVNVLSENQYFYSNVNSMSKSELYVKNISGPRIGADYAINKYLDLLQNCNNSMVLDVGCGPGDITYEKILPVLPKTSKLFAVDILRDRIEYARNRFQMDARLSFHQMDILTDSIPYEFVGSFNLIISLHCLHFVGNHRKAFSNIHKMLRPDGKILVTFIKQNYLHDCYHFLYNNIKFRPFMSNIHNVVSKHRTVQSSKTLLQDVSFEDITCDEVFIPIIKNEDCARATCASLHLFPIPKHLEEEFVQAQLDYFNENGYVSVDGEENKCYDFSYTILVIKANKCEE